MKNFVNVDTRFQKSINLTLDTGDMALVNRYIPTRSSVSILKQYLTNIVRGPVSYTHLTLPTKLEV